MLSIACHNDRVVTLKSCLMIKPQNPDSSVSPHKYIALLTLSSVYTPTFSTSFYKTPSSTLSNPSPSHVRSYNRYHHSQILPISRTQVYTITKAPRQYRQLPSLVLCRRFDDSFGYAIPVFGSRSSSSSLSGTVGGQMAYTCQVC